MFKDLILKELEILLIYEKKLT